MTKSDIAQAFSGGKFELCFPYLKEGTIWNTPGEQCLTGRKEIESFCRKTSAYFNTVETEFQQFNLVENERCVVINGTAEFLRDGKRIAFVSSCDVYEFDADKNLVSIHSYCIPDLKQ